MSLPLILEEALQVVLDESDFEKIFNTIYDCFGSSFEEVTIECNPDDITLSYAKDLEKNMPIE